MIERILRHFPASTHPLTVVSDPDRLLAEEEVLAALDERGFTLIREPDPVRLRHRVEEERPFEDNPLVIVADRALRELPYDLWQQGHRVTLALHTFFPNLAYPLVRALTLTQRWRLSQAPPPPKRLGRRGTIKFLLRHVFDADLAALRDPAALVEWLNCYHQRPDAMPPILVEALLAPLRSDPAYADWPLEELVADHHAFHRFVREQWAAFVGKQTGQAVKEAAARYLLRFEADEVLQDLVPALVRSRALEPVCVKEPGRLPPWTRPALTTEDEDYAPKRAAQLLDILSERMSVPLPKARWEDWQAIARAWAELHTLRYSPKSQLSKKQQAACKQAEEKLDAAFLIWLGGRYAPLGAQRLPIPQHIYHVPHYIAYQRRTKVVDRFALLIMDGMSLADWQLIGSTWRARHPDWRLREQLLLAQIPTITAVSRQALVSGLRPAELDSLTDNRAEPKLWGLFWAAEDIAPEACIYARLPAEEALLPKEISSTRTQALCLIDGTIDEVIHGAQLGAADVQASLRLWLKERSRLHEKLIQRLLDAEYTVFLASDHGHVEARGVGQPSEGLVAEARFKRARVYDDRRAALAVQQGFSETILWEEDGLLPDHLCALMPEGRKAFAHHGDTVVTHGGPTLEEVIVPLVTITKR